MAKVTRVEAIKICLVLPELPWVDHAGFFFLSPCLRRLALLERSKFRFVLGLKRLHSFRVLLRNWEATSQQRRDHFGLLLAPTNRIAGCARRLQDEFEDINFLKRDFRSVWCMFTQRIQPRPQG